MFHVACAADPVDYLRDVKPLLREKCYACHGGLKQDANLRLDTAAGALRGGDSGPAYVVGDAEASLMWQRVTSTDEAVRMPAQGNPLTAEQLETLKSWLDQGAHAPTAEEAEADPRDHWAFYRPERPDIPKVANPAWVRNPIDAFVAVEQERLGLAHSPPTSKDLLLRRVYLDLIGLPPTREELHAFRADDRPDAYERVVERLLDMPHYGERWGRHWMDVWRYSDWFGRRMVPDVWNSAPQVWRWRDWIVHSLNSDKGYDQMVREMLAADEIVPEDHEAMVATSFLVRNWFALNPNQWMRDNLEHTGKAFLGLTFNCAHCHDHKYDPISQDEYFRFRAFFEPIGIRQDRVPGEADPGPFQEYEYGVLRKIQRLGAVRVYDRNPDAPTWFYTGGDERNRVTDRGSASPGVPAALQGAPLNITPVDLPPEAWYPGLRPEFQAAVVAERNAAVTEAEQKLAAAEQAAGEALPGLREQLARIESAVEMERAASGAGTALAGTQSLVLDATTGRRVLSNGLSGLTSLDDGEVIRFLLQIVNDAHVNFQLAKDVVQGLTAGCVLFDRGHIRSYQPGGFTEFEAGVYDFAGGQNRFEVTFVLERSADRSLLSVRSLSDGSVLVDRVPVALNGWNAVGNPVQAISFDARTGSVAAIDDFSLTAADSTLIHFDFEPPEYTKGADIVEIDGWQASPFGAAPATSVVSQTIDNSALNALKQEVRRAQQAVAAQELAITAAAAQLTAARAELASVEARVAADCGRYRIAAAADADALNVVAARSEREATLRSAEAAVLVAEQAFAAAEALPATDGERAAKTTAANSQLTTSRTALDKARAEIDNASAPATYTPLSPVYASQSTGRRRALAEWIASRENPLTARVAVNHIWMRHFHSPLVSSVFDFGRNGALPTHPALLDWLTVELIESGWSMKHLHRLIVTSSTYQQQSRAGNAQSSGQDSAAPSHAAHNSSIDPDNRYLWHFNVGRMEAEVVRDAVLACADRLDRTIGGQELENDAALTTFRRSLYYSCHPESTGKSELGQLFDAPNPTECYRRSRSIVPQQALVLTNSRFIHEQSESLAARLWMKLAPEEQGNPQAFIQAAFEQVLSRGPSEREVELCAEFVQRQRELAESEQTADADARVRESLVRVLFNHNDFLAIR